MNSVIFRTAARAIHPLLLVLSVVLLFKGHNEPGGGFVGGLLAAAAFALYVMGEDPALARAKAHADPRVLIALGLLLALGSGLPGLVATGAFLQGLWVTVDLPGLGPTGMGTPMLFDLGVYFTVLGVALKVILLMAEEGA